VKNIFKGINIKGTIVLCLLGTFLFALFLQPIIDVAHGFSGSIFKFFLDLYYRCAATTQQGNEFIALIAFVVLVAFVSQQIRDIHKTYEKFKILDISEEIQANRNDNIDKIKKHNKENRKYRCIIYFFIAFTILYSIFITVYMYAPRATKASFDNAITKITPYTEVHEINMLRSDWVRMKSRDDYHIIRDRINLIVEKYDLY